MSLRVDMTGNSTGFQQMLNTAKSQAKAFSNSVSHDIGSSWGGIGKNFAAGLAGMFTVQGLKSGLDWFINTGKEIKEQSEQVDMSTDSWQKWSKAIDDSHLSISGFMRIVETLRQKRTEALTDPKVRGKFTRVGLSDADITGDMDMSEFTKRVLAAANRGDQQRSYVADLIGNRGLKYGSASILEKQEKAKPKFSTEDIKNADEADSMMKKVYGAIGRAIIGAVETLRNGYRIAFWSKKDWHMDALNRGMELGKYADPEVLKEQARRKAEAAAKAAAKAAANQPYKEKNVEKDPMDAKLAQQREEIALHEQERQQRLLDSQRGLMTIGDRRASIMGEMPKLAAQIAERNAKMKGEAFLTDAQKKELEGVTGKARQFEINALRTKFQDQTDNLRVRYNKDTSDLKEKPINYNVDSMAKTGLYSASNVAFSPLLSEQQKTNMLLHQVVLNTKKVPYQDPMAP